jgi:hypothetical protein
MKKIIAIVIVAVFAFVLFGCNVAPNVPGVTPYTTSGTRSNGWNYNNSTRAGNTNTNLNNGNFTVKRNAPQSNPYNAPNVNTNKGLNTTPFGGVRRSVNPTDKSLLPGA